MNNEVKFIIAPSDINEKTIEDLVDYIGENLSFNQVMVIYKKLKEMIVNSILQDGGTNE